MHQESLFGDFLAAMQHMNDPSLFDPWKMFEKAIIWWIFHVYVLYGIQIGHCHRSVERSNIFWRLLIPMDRSGNRSKDRFVNHVAVFSCRSKDRTESQGFRTAGGTMRLPGTRPKIVFIPIVRTDDRKIEWWAKGVLIGLRHITFTFNALITLNFDWKIGQGSKEPHDKHTIVDCVTRNAPVFKSKRTKGFMREEPQHVHR